MHHSLSSSRLGIVIIIAGAMLFIMGWTSKTAALAQVGDPPPPTGGTRMTEAMEAFQADRQPVAAMSPQAATPCVGGMAGSYPCANVDLLAFLPLASIGGGAGNDIWGWTDPLEGSEYAIMGRSSGTAFVDISDPENPVYLGNLPTHTLNSTWRDIKVYENHAFIVSEAANHGMQVFDLTGLRSVLSPPATFTETTHYNGFGNAHNIVINEDTGFAYAVGTATCSGGLHMVNIQNPASPVNAGCFSSDGYTHDAQCVLYSGPDSEHQGAEICFNANEDTLTIVDVTNKLAPAQLSRTGYPGRGYTHQGWLTEDQVYFLLDDELDEFNFGHNTRTRVWDVSDLDNPVLIGFHNGTTSAIDHNQYVNAGYTYQANYRSGLRILELTDLANANLTETAFFDIYPLNNNPSFNGAWSVFPYFDSGVVVVSGIEQGLFILRPLIGDAPGVSLNPPSQSRSGEPGEIVAFTFALTNTGGITDTFNLSYSGWNWTTSGLTESPELLPGEGTTFAVTVTIPTQPAVFRDVVLASDVFTLTATSQADPGISAEAIGTTNASASPGVSLSAPQTAQGGPGAVLTFTYTLTNTGTYTDSISLSAAGAWSTTIDPVGTGPLAAGAALSVTLTVNLPADPGGLIIAETTLTATSGLDGEVTASTSATVERMIFRHFLPLIRR